MLMKTNIDISKYNIYLLLDLAQFLLSYKSVLISRHQCQWVASRSKHWYEDVYHNRKTMYLHDVGMKYKK